MVGSMNTGTSTAISTISHPQSNLNRYTPEAQLGRLISPQILLPLILLGAITGFALIYERNRKVLANARFANLGEIRAGKRKGIRNIKKQVPNKLGVSLCSEHNIVLSNVCPGIAAVGISGVGKTESVCSPTIDSLIEQGQTIVVWDKKGDLRKRHAAYAMKHGYEVYSFPEQGLNLLDFMHSEIDAEGAEEIIEGIHANKSKKGARDDGYFGPQGKSALATGCMFAKESPYPDLLMAFAFLSLSNFSARLEAAKAAGTLGTWSGMTSSGLRSVAHAKQTAGGIISTAVKDLQSLLTAQSIPSLLKSDIPLDLDGKKIVFFTFDEQRENSTIPITVSLIEMLVKRNVNGHTKRKKTFCLILDEFAAAFWPSIKQWTSGFRSYGFFVFLGYQNNAQASMRYSKDEALSILSNLSTKFYFKPNDVDGTSEMLSKLCGFTEKVFYENKQKRREKVPLLAASEIELFDIGEALIFSPGIKNRPWRLKIPYNKRDAARRALMEKIWENDLHPQYLDWTESKLERNLELQVKDRMAIADILLPLPEDYQYMRSERSTNQLEPVIGGTRVSSS